MDVWILIAAGFVVIGQIASTITAFLLLSRLIDSKQAAIEHRVATAVSSFIDSPGEGQDSPFAAIVKEAGAHMGMAAANQLVKQIGSTNSHANRLAGNAADALSAEQNPQAAMIGTLLGRGKGAGVARLLQMILPGLLESRGKDHSGSSSRPEIHNRL
jgi:hypothetical protein